ncbi:hypothetical protein A9Q81_26400 [Gammaproteobacteria bacterium 42_54_T18]|nr:hypothetical protein A9Q81_26400 [Gammaproteobacteria bacterium 42_54_T18]
MKRSLLALAVSASIVAPTIALADGPKVYGRMDVSLDNVSKDNGTNGANDSGSSWAVTGHASRFGVKGSAELLTNLKAVYKIEWEVDSDGDGETLTARNRYVGLEGGFGSVLLGQMDTPLKAAQGKIDLFGDHAADIKNVVEGELRAKNVVAYVTPKIADSITAKLALIQVEQNEAEGDCDTLLENDGSTTGDDCENGLFDAYSASIAFSQGGVYAAIAIDDNVPAKKLKQNGKRVDTTRLVLGYEMDAFNVDFLYSTSDEDSEYNASATDLEEQVGYILSGSYKIGKTVVKGQYGSSTTEMDNDKDDIEITMIAFGVEQKFTKQTKLYAEYVLLSTDNAGHDEGVDEEENTLSVGIQHKF